jgi:flagellar basal-body rod protein FlgG
MYKGFYNLTSGMLTQTRVLNTVSNNITNVATPGFKKDVMATTTFRDMVTARTGNSDKSNTSVIGSQSMIRTVQELITIHSQGAIEATGRVFDFAIEGTGFFQIQTPTGVVYTRNGSFTLDDGGNLYLQGVGLVTGTNGAPIHIDSDRFTVNREGDIILQDGTVAGRIAIADWEEYDHLEKVGEGMFQTGTAPQFMNPAETRISWQTLERSNVDVIDEMVDMMTSQRALQSAAQLLKMYDQINAKAVTELGRVQ